MIRILFAALVATLLLPLSRAEAAELCNETSFIAQVALAWREDDRILVEGWTRLRPGECVEAGPDIDPGSDEPLLFYARSSAAYLEGVREWRGPITLCVGPSDFAVEGITDCEPLGLEPRGFMLLEGEHRQRAVLIEPADFGDRAQEAGTQRLLQAAGYDIRAIDGVEGQRTFRAIANFVRDAGLPRTPERPELIDAIEAAAINRNTRLGLRICNDTDERAAVAIARQRGDIWESRGWWRLEPGSCTRAIAARLASADIWYYAELLGETRRPLLGGTERFCFAPSRFSAEGRTACAARGYAEAGFARIAEPVEGLSTVTLTNGNFIPPVALPDHVPAGGGGSE
ncbi:MULTISPECIES: DUF1036 domain-containing protein [Hyphobacterium]|uniref:DUF1036 domain-containing protein n=1 Tax=Hyphobacterium vulgare TaxID=1736751 RepID=A0ABV6ZV04_9PROT